MTLCYDLRSYKHSLSNREREALIFSGFSGIRTRDLCDTGAVLYQLSYEATVCREQVNLVSPSVPLTVFVPWLTQ